MVTGPLARHLAGSLRLRVGESLTLVQQDVERVLDGQVTAVDKDRVGIDVTAERPCPPEPAHITLVVGMPKGKKLEEVVRHTVEAGVSRIIPVFTERAVPRPREAVARGERLSAIALEAAQQSGRYRVPEVSAPIPLTAYLVHGDTRADPDRPGGSGLRVMLWEEERVALFRQVVVPPVDRVTLFVGPEGGITPGEAAQLKDAGFNSVSLGPHTLRTETACVAAVALTVSLLWRTVPQS